MDEVLASTVTVTVTSPPGNELCVDVAAAEDEEAGGETVVIERTVVVSAAST